DRVSRLPGVTAVTGSTCLPLVEDGPRFTSTMRVQGRVLPPGTISPAVGFCAVAAGHFEAMGMSVIRGRSIGRDDVERREAVAGINQALPRAHCGAEDPIGRRVTLGPPRNQLWLTIVGIVRNTPVRALTEPAPMPQLFLPMSIARAGDLPVAPDVAVMNYVVRVSGAPLGLLPGGRGGVRSVGANLAPAPGRALQDNGDRASAQAAFTMSPLGVASHAAVLPCV